MPGRIFRGTGNPPGECVSSCRIGRPAKINGFGCGGAAEIADLHVIDHPPNPLQVGITPERPSARRLLRPQVGGRRLGNAVPLVRLAPLKLFTNSARINTLNPVPPEPGFARRI